MKNISISFFTFLNLLLLACCSKEEPCPTCFEDIVTCKVNGKEWRSNCVSNDPLFGCRAVNTYYYYNDDKAFSLSCINDNENSGFHLGISSKYGGLYLGINPLKAKSSGYSNFDLVNNCKKLDTLNETYSNILEIIEIDTINFIIEGKFQFKVYNLCGDTATITDGYFKTKFIF